MELAACMGLLGFSLGGSIVVCSIYVQEFLLEKHKSIVIAAVSTFEGLVLFFATLYFLYITKDWHYWYYGVTTLQLLVILGLFWLPESPDFLFAKGRFAESREVIMRIAEFNGKGDEVNREMICFGGHRPDYYFRGTRDENFRASLQTPGSQQSPSAKGTPSDGKGRMISLQIE